MKKYNLLCTLGLLAPFFPSFSLGGSALDGYSTQNSKEPGEIQFGFNLLSDRSRLGFDNNIFDVQYHYFPNHVVTLAVNPFSPQSTQWLQYAWQDIYIFGATWRSEFNNSDYSASQWLLGGGGKMRMGRLLGGEIDARAQLSFSQKQSYSAQNYEYLDANGNTQKYSSAWKYKTLKAPFLITLNWLYALNSWHKIFVFSHAEASFESYYWVEGKSASELDKIIRGMSSLSQVKREVGVLAGGGYRFSYTPLDAEISLAMGPYYDFNNQQTWFNTEGSFSLLLKW